MKSRLVLISIIIGILIIVNFTNISAFTNLEKVTNFIDLNEDARIPTFFDNSPNHLHYANVNGRSYEVVYYSNPIPNVSGMEIYDPYGAKVTDYNTARYVFKTVAFVKASNIIPSDDLEFMKFLQQSSSSTVDSFTPVKTKLDSVISSINYLQNDLCVNVIAFKACAWDLLEYYFPQSWVIEQTLRGFDSELSAWYNALYSVERNLPATIKGIEDLKYNQRYSASLESDVKKTTQSISSLRSKTSQYQGTLGDISNVLGSIQSGLYSGSDWPVIGSALSSTANAVGDVNNDVTTLEQGFSQYSNRLSIINSNLNRFLNQAQSDSDSMYYSWSDRQIEINNWNMLFIIGGMTILAIIIIIPISIAKKRKSKEAASELVDYDSKDEKPSDETPPKKSFWKRCWHNETWIRDDRMEICTSCGKEVGKRLSTGEDEKPKEAQQLLDSYVTQAKTEGTAKDEKETINDIEENEKVLGKLKERLAKGEITLHEYKHVKKEITK